jgi:threonine aldolase
MRQAGVFAAAGLVGLSQMVGRLAEDHENARELAVELADLGWTVEPAPVETNIFFATVDTPDFNLSDFVAALDRAGVRINPPRGRRLRFVTHADVSRRDIRTASRIVARTYRDMTRGVAHERQRVR